MDLPPPGRMVRQMVLERMSVVVVTTRPELGDLSTRGVSRQMEPDDADGGSAAPVSADGYFLTADHVLARMEGKNVFVVYNRGGGLLNEKARVVWRSSEADLALLHIPARTPYFYRWSAPGSWIPEGAPIVHGGISTGPRSPVGKMGTPIPPDKPWGRSHRFKIDIPLEPGDSGRPVVNGHGALVGINSAVEFLVPLETAFFVESEGNRPNVRMIENLINRDRSRNGR